MKEELYAKLKYMYPSGRIYSDRAGHDVWVTFDSAGIDFETEDESCSYDMSDVEVAEVAGGFVFMTNDGKRFEV